VTAVDFVLLINYIIILCSYRIADTYKSEGNDWFLKNQFSNALECYTKAIENCPVSVIERLATYHRYVYNTY